MKADYDMSIDGPDGWKKAHGLDRPLRKLSYSFTLSPPVIAACRRVAEMEGRSLSNFIEQLLKKELKRREKKK